MWYIDAKRLIDSCIEKEILIVDKESEAIWVFCEAGERPEGWYPMPIEAIYHEVMENAEAQRVLTLALKEKGVNFTPQQPQLERAFSFLDIAHIPAQTPKARTFAADIEQAVEAEKKAKAYARELMQRIVQEIRSTPIPDVEQLPGAVNCFVISLSTIKDNWMVMAPVFYSAQAQAEIVENALKGKAERGVSDLLDKLAAMVTDKAVTVDKNRYRLNDTTLSILKKVMDSARG